jgi:hypothetical protein
LERSGLKSPLRLRGAGTPSGCQRVPSLRPIAGPPLSAGCRAQMMGIAVLARDTVTRDGCAAQPRTVTYSRIGVAGAAGHDVARVLPADARVSACLTDRADLAAVLCPDAGRPGYRTCSRARKDFIEYSPSALPRSARRPARESGRTAHPCRG